MKRLIQGFTGTSLVLLAGLFVVGCSNFTSTKSQQLYMATTTVVNNAVGNVSVQSWASQGKASEEVEFEIEKKIQVFLAGHGKDYYFDKMTAVPVQTDQTVALTTSYPTDWGQPFFFPEFNLGVYAPLNTVVNVTTVKGDMTLSDFIGTLTALTKRGTITSSNVHGVVSLENWDGDIAVTTTTIKGDDLTVVSNNGNIVLTLPDNSAFNLEAEATGGKIQSATAFAIKTTNTREGQTGTGIINGGAPNGAKITLTAKNGSIEIKKK